MDREERVVFLRLLLLHVPGETSYENLRTFQSITYAKFFEPAVARSLVKVHSELQSTLRYA